MLTEDGRTKAEGNGGLIQPFDLSLRNLEKGTEKGIKGRKTAEAGNLSSKGGYGFTRGYPFVAPSVESLTPSEKVLRMKPTAANPPKTLDPWVIRCRVAAVTSGILLFVALLVAIEVIGKHR